MAFELQFLGGVGTVTGSKYLLAYKNHKILVDCGLFQGLKALRLKNWDSFPVNPSEIEAMILTHAHIDHSGYIPKLIKEGFKGKIYSTHATRDLCKILLPDSGYLMEEEADYLNRTQQTKHTPALPLFTIQEAEASLQYFSPVSFKSYHTLGTDLGFELQNVGHILGAASVILHVNGKKIAFTGDIGRISDEVLHSPACLPKIDYLVTESTYGNRLHENKDPLNILEQIIHKTYKNRGVILVPSFAVGRAFTIMHYLSILRKQNRIPMFPMYINSPMATRFTEVFFRYKELHKISDDECSQINKTIQHIRTTEESKSLNMRKGPMLIISASGMITGGRILHHIKKFGPDENNTILLTGFQAAGTRGEALENGATEIKVHGEYVPIRAKVYKLDISAHADYREMIGWFAQSCIQPKKVFITHGEPSASDELRRRLEETFQWNCHIPQHLDRVLLE